MTNNQILAAGRFLDELDLAGIGPHQLAMMPDGSTMVVALGGLQTHPDQGRKKLNLETMQSALVYLDSRNGDILDRLESPQRHLSLRHLDVAINGSVVVGAQFNTAGGDYRELNMKDKLPAMTVDDALELLASRGNLVKRPFLLSDGAEAMAHVAEGHTQGKTIITV